MADKKMTPRKRRPRTRQQLDSPRLAEKIADLMLDKKAMDVVMMDVRELTSVTDFFMICSGESDVQIKAVVDHIKESLSEQGEKPFHVEGYENLSWVLMDYIDVVVHVFIPESRNYYAFERLWADAKTKFISDETT